jgi:PIN domain nuclease of toxin-antitoxin system
MRPLLDTHIWLWWLGGEPHLSKQEMASLDELPAEQRPFISDISLWEVAVLLELGRWNIAIPFQAWLKAACHPRTVEILPITQEIAAEVTRLPTAFHRDPADRIIVSTARARDIPLFTRDRRILDARLTKKWAM